MISASHSDLGTCYICHKSISANNAAAHLKNCSQTAGDVQDERIFLLKVATENQFWLFVRANSSTTLRNLYLFLRNNWFECCGMMSEFYISGTACNAADMEKSLQQMLGIGKTFQYEHNSGVPIKVTGEVLEIAPGRLEQEMQLVLRKNIIDERCESCEKIQ